MAELEHDSQAHGTPSRWRWALPISIAALTSAAFFPSLFNGFLDWDDNVGISGNPFVHGFSPTNVRWAFTSFLLGHYHPLTWLSFMLDYTLWGLDPRGYHLTNLALHVASALLFYAIVIRLLRARDGGSFRAFEPAQGWAAAAAALLFAVHPLRVESVAWATERRDVLSGFLLLLAVVFYLRKQEAEIAGRSGTKALAISLACYASSLFSKSIGATLPIVLLVLDAYPLGRLRTGPGWFPRWRRVALEKVPYLALGLFVGVIALVAEGREGAARSLVVHDLASRLAQSAYGACFYVWKTLMPTRLSPLYLLEDALDPRRPIHVISGVFVVAATAGLVVFRRRWPAGLAAWLCYLAIVAPVLGLYQVGLQKVADRYTYLPCLPFAALAAGGLYALERRRRAGRTSAWPVVAAWAAVALIVASLCALTHRQTRLWRDSATLWGQAIRVEPDNHVAYNYRALARYKAGDFAGADADFERAISLRPDLGYFYRAVTRQASGDLDGAIRDLDRSLELRPGYAIAHLNRAVVRMQRGDPGGAAADCEAALRADARIGEAHNILGVIRENRGDPVGALDEFGAALAAEPALVEAWTNRGRVLASLGRLDEAVSNLDRAVQIDPASAAARLQRARLRDASGNVEGALADCDAAIALAPGNPDGYNNRGSLRLKQGDLDGARANFDAAIARDPRHAFAFLNRCFVRQLQNDIAGAIDDCNAALAIDPRLAEAYVGRAKARGLSGDAAGTRADLERALELIPKDASIRGDVEAMLAATH